MNKKNQILKTGSFRLYLVFMAKRNDFRIPYDNTVTIPSIEQTMHKVKVEVMRNFHTIIVVDNGIPIESVQSARHPSMNVYIFCYIY